MIEFTVFYKGNHDCISENNGHAQETMHMFTHTISTHAYLCEVFIYSEELLNVLRCILLIDCFS